MADAASGSEGRADGGNLFRPDHDPRASRSQTNRVPCEICGFFNHATKDYRRNLCEICGLNNHSTYDCK